MGCKSSKVKQKRDEAKEIEEREKAEKEAKELKEKEDAAAQAEAEAKKKLDAENAEAEANALAKAAQEEEKVVEPEPEQVVEETSVEPVIDEPESNVSPDEVGSVGTMSIGQEGSAFMPTYDVKPEKPQKITVASHAGAAIITGRSVTPCDMTLVDQVAKYVAVQCGCDLGDIHEENMCPVCVNMDLSDAPLLN